MYKYRKGVLAEGMTKIKILTNWNELKALKSKIQKRKLFASFNLILYVSLVLPVQDLDYFIRKIGLFRTGD